MNIQLKIVTCPTHNTLIRKSFHCADVLGNEYVLRSHGEFTDRHAARRRQVPHRLLPVGSGRVARPGFLLLYSVPRVACLQRTVWNQYQQPRRSG